MRYLILIVMLAAQAWGANYACTNTGSTGARTWTDTTAWTSCNSTYPNNGGGNTYTATVGTGYLLTIPSGVSITLGQSAANNTANLTINATGSLTLAAGTATAPTTLTMQGDVGVVGQTTCTVCNAIVMNPSTAILIDSNGSGTSYQIGQTQNGDPRKNVYADCTDATAMPAWAVGTTYGVGYRVSYGGQSYVSVAAGNVGNTPDLFDSAYWKRGNCLIASVGATNGYLSQRGFGFGGGNIVFKHAAIYKLGSASVAWATMVSDSSNNPAGTFDIEDSHIDSSGTNGLSTGGTFVAATVVRIDRSIITNPLGTNTLGTTTAAVALSGGVRSVSGSVFMGPINLPGAAWYLKDFTISSNYFHESIASASGCDGSHNAASISGDFVHIQKYALGTADLMSGVCPGVTNSYIFLDSFRNNPHWFTFLSSTNGQLVTGSVIEPRHAAAGDSGEVAMQISNSVVHHDELGYASSEFQSGSGTTNQVFYHNTWWGGYSAGKNFAMVDFNEGSPSNGVLTMKSNIAYAQDGYAGTMWKTANVGASVGTDACNPNTLCDYNAGYNYNSTQSPCVGCTNQGRGYAGSAWTANTMGLHDLDITSPDDNGGPGGAPRVNPRFGDVWRNVALFATRYLGYSPGTAWATSTAYNVGDFRYVQNSSYNGNYPVLMRCIRAHTSDATNQPILGTWSVAASNLTSVVVASNVATVTVTGGLLPSVGDWVEFDNLTFGPVNGPYQVTGTGANTFTVAMTMSNGTVSQASTVVTSWATWWEYASLYYIRLGVAQQATITDGAIGCSGCTYIEALRKWVFTGFTPASPKFWCAGHDGETIGAVAFCAAGKAMIGAVGVF